jgi:hypothetical protein
LKWHFPLAILLHLFKLVLHNDSLVDHPLKIFIVSVEKLKLNLIVESIQECILFFLIGVYIVRRIPYQLSKSVEILIYSHIALLQFREFFLLKLQGTTGYIMSFESSLELILGDSTNIRVRVVVSFPPVYSGSK